MITATFVRYTVHEEGTRLVFTLDGMGPGQDTEITILLTDAEVAGLTTLGLARVLVTAKLQRRLMASGIAPRLDSLLGQSVIL